MTWREYIGKQLSGTPPVLRRPRHPAMGKTKSLFFLHVILATSVLFPAPAPATALDEAAPRRNNLRSDGIHGSDGGSSKAGSPEWQVLTKRNFSSQIRRHPHVLVMVTVPWSGESRSLMKEVSHAFTNNQQLFGDLKLMVVYRNFEKILADVLGATEGVALLYYNHAKLFRYQGRLRAQNILSSVSHVMSLQHVEFPLKFLSTVEELENFFQSTDKAVLLLEFCGWSAKLLHDMNNGTGESSFNEQRLLHYGDTQGANFISEADGTPFGRKDNQKGSENSKLTCGVEGELSGVPGLGDFALANETASLNIEARPSDIGTACTLDKLQQFESVFAEFNKIAKEFFLPPERQRFGVISERSLLPSLNLGEPDTWMLLIWFSGFPGLSKVLEDVNDLRVGLQKHHSAIVEVDGDQRNEEEAFPVNGPSIILFIDRSSESLKIREESKSALEIYRQLAHHYQLPHQLLRDQGNDHPKISPMEAFQETQNKGPFGPHGHMMTKDLSTSRIVKVGDKMGFMVMNEVGSISLHKSEGDNRDNRAYDVLQHLLHQGDSAVKTKEVKMSLLAKEIGFQLLSDDFDVKVIDWQPSHQEGDSMKSTSESSIERSENEISEHLLESSVSVHDDDNTSDTADVAAAADGKESEQVTVRSVLQWTPDPVPSGKSVASLSSAEASQKSSKDSIQLLKSTGADADIIYSELVELSQSMSHTGSDLDFHDDKEPVEKDHVDHTDCTLNYTCHHEVAHMSTQHSVNKFSVQADVTKEQYSTGIGDLQKQQAYHHAFTGSFFFSDGEHRWLRRLTGGLEIPSMVILDPVLQQHYVLPKEKYFTFDSLVAFVDKFLNGSLSPYQHSEPVIQSPRKTPQPPFVNLDFHEADGIPRVTANTFSELVLNPTYCEDEDRTPSSKDKEYGCAWKGDILVLFSNSWCGFCQRMELVVREVYRTFKNFKSLLSDPTNTFFMPLRDKPENASMHDLASIYHMDCTLNDCSSFLRQYGKGEVYPSLVLFQAEKEEAITYEADMSVFGILEFLADHGGNSHNLNEYRGILWNQGQKGHRSGKLSNDVFPTIVNERTPVTEDDKHRDLPMDTPEVRGNNQQPFDLQSLNGYPDEGEQVAVGSVLIATDKLLNASPFDKSSILIVKADQNEGFQGLILNKHINWDILQTLDKNINWDIFEKLGKDLAPLKQAPLSYGGPVWIRDLPLLSLARKLVIGYSKVASNIYFGDPLATAVAIEGIRTQNASATDFWFFLGCSSWGWNQLFDELAEGAWQLSNLNTEHFEWPEI